jgi:heme-degrading monooxygenase HmoA
MIAVIFELEPKHDQKEAYFSAAESLKPLLKNIDGFISIERFQSVSSPNHYLSLSFWKNEEAVAAWRNHELHRTVQHKGREDIFLDYRLRVASVLRDYSMTDRQQVPSDSADYMNSLNSQ